MNPRDRLFIPCGLRLTSRITAGIWEKDPGNTDHLTIRQAEVSEIMAEDGKIRGVKTFSGAVYYAKAVILVYGKRI